MIPWKRSYLASGEINFENDVYLSPDIPQKEKKKKKK